MIQVWIMITQPYLKAQVKEKKKKKSGKKNVGESLKIICINLKHSTNSDLLRLPYGGSGSGSAIFVNMTHAHLNQAQQLSHPPLQEQ